MLPADFSALSVLATDAPTQSVGVAFAASLLLSVFVGQRRLRRRRTSGNRHDARTGKSDVSRELLVPVVQNDPDHIERATVINRVSQLAVADDWLTLSRQISHWENELASTPGGMRKHELGIETCLAGLQSLLDEMPRDNIDQIVLAEAEVERFVVRQRQSPTDHVLAVLAARAHMIVGASCRADFWPEDQHKPAWRRMALHYVEAETILEPFDPLSFMSPLVAEACYHLAMGLPDGGKRLRPAFEDWIDLDPSNPAIYATHAPMLLPGNFGSVSEYLEGADNARIRTAETLGRGGYALFCLPLIDEDESVRDKIDAETFAGGLLDLASLSGTQAETNWAAALLISEAEASDPERMQIFVRTFHRLVRRHLGVIYPRFWHIDLPEIRALLKAVYEQDEPETRRSYSDRTAKSDHPQVA